MVNGEPEAGNLEHLAWMSGSVCMFSCCCSQDVDG